MVNMSDRYGDISLCFATRRRPHKRDFTHHKANNYIIRGCQSVASKTSPRISTLSRLSSNDPFTGVFPDRSSSVRCTSTTEEYSEQQTEEIIWFCLLIGLGRKLRHGLIIYGENSGLAQRTFFAWEKHANVHYRVTKSTLKPFDKSEILDMF